MIDTLLQGSSISASRGTPDVIHTSTFTHAAGAANARMVALGRVTIQLELELIKVESPQSGALPLDPPETSFDQF